MITMITGMPGDGKTLFAVTQILKRLVETERFIVTNIPLRLNKVHEYVSREREKRAKGMTEPPPEWNMDERLLRITDQEAYEFFRYRSGGYVLPPSPDMQLEDGEKKLPKKDHDVAMLANFKHLKAGADRSRPCDYYIDEVHEIFPSREWDKGGRGILFYASKHRHLHDEVFLITQQIDQVEKQLRNLVSETVIVRNHLRRNVGIFKMRPCFKTKFVYGLPSPTSKPFMSPTMFLDTEGAAGCYKTTGALGVHDAPESVKNKGWLPWWVAWVAGGVGVVGILLAFIGLPALGGKMASGVFDKGGVLDVSKIAPGPKPPPPPPSVVGQGEKGTAPAAAPQTPVPGDSRHYFRGYVRRGRQVNVVMEDGRIITEADAKIIGYRNAVEIDGVRYELRAPVAKAAPPPAPHPKALPSVFGGGGAQPPEGASETGGRPDSLASPADVVPVSESPSPFANTYRVPEFSGAKASKAPRGPVGSQVGAIRKGS